MNRGKMAVKMLEVRRLLDWQPPPLRHDSYLCSACWEPDCSCIRENSHKIASAAPDLLAYIVKLEKAVNTAREVRPSFFSDYGEVAWDKFQDALTELDDE